MEFDNKQVLILMVNVCLMEKDFEEVYQYFK